MKKKGFLKVIARTVMSFYREVKTKVKVSYEEFLVQLGVNQGSVLSSLLFCNCGR